MFNFDLMLACKLSIYRRYKDEEHSDKFIKSVHITTNVEQEPTIYIIPFIITLYVPTEDSIEF